MKRLKRDPEGSTALDAVVAVPVAGNHDANASADDGVSLSSPSSVPIFSKCDSSSNSNDRKMASVRLRLKRKANSGYCCCSDACCMPMWFTA